MKKILIFALALMSGLAYSQTKKKVYKKPIKKTTKTVKKTAPKPKPTTAVVEPKEEIVKEVEETPIIVEEPKVEEPKEEKPITKVYIDKLSKKRGWLRYRNSVLVRGIEVAIKGSYVNKDKIYLMFDVHNRTNIEYDIESVSFVTASVGKKGKYIAQEEKIFIPIDSNQPETIGKKANYKLIYVFDKFTISDDVDLIFTMDENNGDRSINLPIKSKVITNSEYIK